MKYLVIDCAFNKSNYPSLIGKLVDEPPGYAIVQPQPHASGAPKGGMCVVCYGDPIEGFTLIGPFNNPEEGAQYAERNAPDYESWWVLQIESPEVFERDEPPSDAATRTGMYDPEG